MKKLMIVVCAATFAVVTQAASINWGGAISEPDGVTELAVGTMAYLIFSDAAFTSDGAVFDGSKLSKGDATIATAVSSHSITSGEAANWEFMQSYDKAGSDVNGFYAVLVSDNGSTPKYSFFDLGEVSGTTAASATTDLTVTWDTGSITQNGYTVESQSVPEPTSGLLLLLGVAGIALRRRRV